MLADTPRRHRLVYTASTALAHCAFRPTAAGATTGVFPVPPHLAINDRHNGGGTADH